jgi:multiple sugar transport system substrate-binding protein
MHPRTGKALAALAVVLALAGCTGTATNAPSTPGATTGPGETTGPTPGASAKVTSINYWYWQDDTTDPTIRNLASQFEQLYGIHVNIQDSIAQPQFYQSLVNAVAAGNAPDATHLNTNMFGQLIQANVLEPLDSMIDGWAGKDDVIPTMWDFDKGPDGKIYSMPNKFLMFYMYYRTDLFAKYNVAVPKTQQEFVQAAKAITHPSDHVYGFDIRGGPNGQDQWAAFLVAGGARFLDDSGNVAFNSPEAKASNNLYVATYPDGTNPGAVNDGFAQIKDNFKAGVATMIINHLGAAKELDAWDSEKTGVALIPSTTGDPSKTTYMGTMNANAVLAASEKKDAAFKWISFLAEHDAQLAITKSTNGYLPVVKSVASDPQFKTNKYMQVSLQAAEHAVTAWPAIPGTTVATQKTWQPLFQGALLGQNSADAVVEGVANTLTSGK